MDFTGFGTITYQPSLTKERSRTRNTGAAQPHRRKRCAHLIDHVDWQSHHAEVVHDQDSFEVEGFAVLHDAGAQRRHKVDVRRDDDGLGERGRHEEPVLRPGVCQRRQAVTLQF